ncbi:nitroreductase/quinone reductase family protein [Streptomyces xiaopingdaonensis]|uniref:nitroreductase/quinone reductase family protein n=1 Tax=Streptomyces xiaopingdaonensis TaxID=1565415 RepID=UPI003B4310FA
MPGLPSGADETRGLAGLISIGGRGLPLRGKCGSRGERRRRGGCQSERGSWARDAVFADGAPWAGRGFRPAGRRLERAPIALLTTTGARTGQAGIAPLMHFGLGGRRLVATSKAGMDTRSARYHNTRNSPAGRGDRHRAVHRDHLGRPG